MSKIHIVPGWAEGNWHFKQFVRHTAELTLERDAAEADIILAHSSGVYSLPPLQPHQSIVLIDPPYWPGRSIWARAFRHVILDIPKQLRNYGWWFWLRLRTWNIIFLLIEPWRHIKIWRSLRSTFDITRLGNSTILLWDSQDAYCGPSIKKIVESHEAIRVVEMHGLHETCWAHPEAYIQQLLKEL